MEERSWAEYKKYIMGLEERNEEEKVRERELAEKTYEQQLEKIRSTYSGKSPLNTSMENHEVTILRQL